MAEKLFDQIAGQDRALTQLKAALANNRLAPTLLFTGPDEASKSLAARAVVQFLACDKRNGCGVCGPCIRVAKRSSESLIETSPASSAGIKIDQIRTLLSEISLQTTSRARGVIFENAESLNQQAANALLKTLEEPPAQTWFFLLAPSVARVLPTLRSRAQVVTFRSGSYGSALENIDEELLALKTAAIEFWKSPTIGNWYESSSRVTSRETAFWVTRFWQEILRDAFYFKNGLTPVLHRDFLTVSENLSRHSDAALLGWSRAVLELEKDLQGNADIALSFDNFVRNELHG